MTQVTERKAQLVHPQQEGEDQDNSTNSTTSSARQLDTSVDSPTSAARRLAQNREARKFFAQQNEEKEMFFISRLKFFLKEPIVLCKYIWSRIKREDFKLTEQQGEWASKASEIRKALYDVRFPC